MRLHLALFVASFAAALPAEYVQLDPELAARRANITERMVHIHDRQAAVSVDERFKGKGKLWFGTATDRGLLQREKNSAIIQANFGQVTPENSMKWQSLESTRGQYNWGDADFLVDFATQNNKYIRGHTLVWHSQLPSWVANINNANTLREVLRTHVQTVVGRYKGKIHSWDVVNEIFNEDGTLRNSVFSRLLGEEFVSIAFREARAADPTARLYINDYNLDRPNISKVNQMRSYVDKWISQGIPIDGIGSQAHLGAGGGGPVQGAIQQLATAAVTEVSITELDIASAPANDYTAVVRGCLNTPKCVGITVWGISDKDSWRSGTSPLLFDNSFNPKGAYNSIVGIL